MDSEGGEGRPPVGAARGGGAAPLRADRRWKIFCNILQAGGVGAWYHIPARQGR